MPTPIPPTTLQAMRSTAPNARPEPMAEMKNRAAANTMARTRPILSARLPPPQAPRMQPSRAEETVKPIMNSESPKRSWIGPTAPLITAVSKPKRKPPNAATSTTQATAEGRAFSDDWWTDIRRAPSRSSRSSRRLPPRCAHYFTKRSAHGVIVRLPRRLKPNSSMDSYDYAPVQPPPRTSSPRVTARGSDRRRGVGSGVAQCPGLERP